MLKNVTITLPEEVARWARLRAAEEDLSVSKLVANLLEAQMKRGEEYQDAYRRWKKIKPQVVDAERRLTREQTHARR